MCFYGKAFEIITYQVIQRYNLKKNLTDKIFCNSCTAFTLVFSFQVYKIEAIDPENTSLSYFIDSKLSDVFKVNKTSGEILTATNIQPFAVGTQFSIKINVVDSGIPALKTEITVNFEVAGENNYS